MKRDTCGCCEGTEQLTPQTTANRPGLDALSYRIGTHGTFLETMKARLARMCISEDGECDDDRGLYPLRALTTRDSSDPAIALLDAWATAGDVLTFYQERIANEGYLRTAVERRSILELANLVGYRLRPGVAASVYLAFLLEDTFEDEAEIPEGTRAQSLPGPGEEPQSFETSEPLLARASWNQIRPRLERPQRLSPGTITSWRPIYLQGTDHNLVAGDVILVEFSSGDPGLYRINTVDADLDANKTKLTLRDYSVGDTAVEARDEIASSTRLGRLPTGLRARPLNNFATGLATIGESEPTDLDALVWQFADALLATFTVLAETAPSDARDDAIAADVKSLTKIKSLVQTMLAKLPDTPTPPNIKEPLLKIREWTQQSLDVLEGAQTGDGGDETTTSLGSLIATLSSPIPDEALPPASPLHRPHDPSLSYGIDSDFRLAAVTNLLPHTLSKQDLYQGLQTAKVTPDAPAKLYVLRTEAAPFGHNAPPRPVSFSHGRYTYGEWTIDDPLNNRAGSGPDNEGNGPNEPIVDAAVAGDNSEPIPPHHEPTTLYLDNEYEVEPGSWVVVKSSNVDDPIILNPAADDIQPRSLIAYGLSGKSLKLELGEIGWFETDGADFSVVRQTRVHLQSEELTLAEEPMPPQFPAPGGPPNQIVVNGLYDGLEPGRWLILSGERADIEGVSGVRASELVMLQNVEQVFEEDLLGDTYHTRVTFANDLAHTYKRETVTLYANVINATHGQTREEVLGSGDGSVIWQQFTLKHSPLTYLSAPTPAGAASTLEVRVNDILWHEAGNHFTLGPTDRAYVARTDNEDNTSVIFGNGEHGARLPTGAENVTAVYRSGIGRPGNVKAEQIKLLASRPLGVKSVINPLPASGGADRERRDQARGNAPLAVMALDRLVSVQDYADFARTFAGIGKARATSLTDGRQEIVHLTIAGADDIPIAESSDLYRNLHQALQRAGDPHQPFEIAVRELMLLVIAARVRIHPDYLWEKVAVAVQEALLEAFSFENQDLGQDVLLSEVISEIQHVPGVTYVDVDTLATISETEAKNEELLTGKLEMLAGSSGGRPEERIPVELAQLGDGGERLAAQLAFLSPDVPETLVLQEITS